MKDSGTAPYSQSHLSKKPGDEKTDGTLTSGRSVAFPCFESDAALGKWELIANGNFTVQRLLRLVGAETQDS